MATLKNNPVSKKVIVIGLDGASHEIFFNRWQDEFPNIKKIKEKAYYGHLKSCLPPVTAPAWVSFATGCNPGKHGVFEYLYQDEKTSELRPVSSLNIKVKTVYEILKDHGLKSIIINLPVSYPPKTDDIILTSLLTRGNEFIFPKKIKEEIPQLQKYRLVPNPEYDVEGNKKKFIEDISNLERDKFEAAKILFKKEWNFFFILFGGTDWIQHKFYHQMVTKSKKRNSLILDFYKELDSYIGWFWHHKEKETPLFIISDHGFKAYQGVIGLNNLLEKYGYLHFKRGNQEEAITTRRQREVSKIVKQKKMLTIPSLLASLLIKNKIFLETIKSIYRLLIQPRIKFYTTPKGKEVNLEHTQAYCRSTESQGIVIKKEGKNIKKELIKKLENENIFSQILENTDAYQGPFTHKAPDILLKSDRYQITKIQFESIIHKNTNGHDYEGIFILANPFQPKKKYIDREIIDIAPTLLKLLGIDHRKYNMDGEPLFEPKT